ncbi:twin-arginine translocase TatA/TatE family subunit [Mesobacillus foraminis]|uniref:Sec-independent protein translocase protein TatA n=1 Tax=Mesobacillus foraminis TaxID=279826 RepID=A0A4R2BCL9_9BACI|nr:twin-arginine translocase TatA/TatE family subunit [Mesobacillus foraminis]TCN24223.1 sec-independent protein translocase protein TatA [Mesobacillus foraminis]
MVPNIGVPGFILITITALIIFGPNKLPELGRALGSTIREFKRAAEGLAEDSKKDQDQSDEGKTKGNGE